MIIASISGFVGGTKCAMASSMGFGIVALIAGIAGTILDLIGYSFIGKLHACSNQNLEIVGDQGYGGTAAACALSNPDWTCNCVQQSLTDDSDADCFVFGLFNGNDDCSVVLDTEPLLRRSFGLCLGATIFIAIFAVIACSSVCCPNKCCGFVEDRSDALAEGLLATESIPSTLPRPSVVSTLSLSNGSDAASVQSSMAPSAPPSDHSTYSRPRPIVYGGASGV
jgi:hypothetical protein